MTLTFQTSATSHTVEWVGMRQATSRPAPVYWVYTNLIRLRFTREQLLGMPPTAASDRILAEAILEIAGAEDEAADPDGVLAFASVPEGYLPRTDTRYYGGTLAVLSTSRGAYVRRGDFGPADEMPLERPDFHLDRTYGTLAMRMPVASSNDTFAVRIRLGAAAFIVLMLWLIWLGGRTGASLLLRRRARRWRASGRCTACGYQISPGQDAPHA